jgi:hypothetical protein
MTSLLLIAIFFSVTSLHPRASDMRVCSFTGNSGIAQFCNANITQALCVAGSGNIFFGNTARVDQEYGDDTKASVGGSPFLTISAALAAVAPGNVVWIGPGTYDETINIPAGVIVTGISHAAVIIRAMNVTQSTDLVTMGEGAVLQQATLEMSSAADVQLRAIVHPGSIPQVGITVYNVNITIDATFAGAGTTPIYGIHFTGNADLTSADVVFGGVTSITVAGTGRKVRWVYVDSPALVEITSSIGQVFGGNNSIGLEVNNPAANLAVGAGAAGGDTADISRIAGLLQITAIYLVHSTANGLGFTNLLFPQTFTWAEPDTPIGPPGIFYLRPGTGQATGFPVLLHLFQKGVAYAMSVHAITPPGIGESSTFILQINGVNTPLTLTLTDTQTDATLLTTSATFIANDNFSLEVVNSAGAQTGDAVVTVGVY